MLRASKANVCSCVRRGFTLIELIAVVAIIGILLSLVSPLVSTARKHARQADCRSNLRQFGIALTVYRADYNGKNPDWMSSLYPKYIDNLECFICKSDKKHGEGEVIPMEVCSGSEKSVTDFNPELVDNSSRSSRPSSQNPSGNVEANSYSYEFSGESCSWDHDLLHDRDGDGTVTWGEAKEWQLAHGDKASERSSETIPYAASRMPIIRCWHHYGEGRLRGHVQNSDGSRGNISNDEYMTLNVAYAGNVFVAPPWWEGCLEPGEK